MYEALTGIMVIVITLCAKHVIRPPKIPFSMGNACVTLLISGYQMTNAFEIPRVSEERLIDQLRAGDGEI